MHPVHAVYGIKMVDENNNVKQSEEPKEHQAHNFWEERRFEEWRDSNRIAINVVNLAMAEFLETCRTYGIDHETICAVLAAVRFEMSRDMTKEEKDLNELRGEKIALWMKKEVEEQERAEAMREAMQEGYATLRVLPVFPRR